MSSRLNPLPLLEAAYAFELDEHAWLEHLADAARALDLGAGVAVATCALGKKVGYRAVASRGSSVEPSSVLRIHEALPRAIFRAVNAPAAAASNRAKFAWFVEQFPEYRAAAARVMSLPGLPNGWGAFGGDADVETVLLFCETERMSIGRAHRRTLDAVGAHLGAALRLRSALRGPPGADGPRTEAVLTPGGKVLDLRGPAAESSAVELVLAAKRTERARSRRATDEERLSLWTALFEGRWSIVETTERDGKRMLLACRNEPRVARYRELTARERAIIGYVALGHSYTYVAYELGVSVSSVSHDARSALGKLGFRTRAELTRAFWSRTDAPDQAAP